MDTLTHMALGAAVGEVVGGKMLGRKAAVAGAIVAILPDLDVAVQPFLSSAASMLFHRGITHSFIVWLVVAPLVGYFIWRFYRKTPMQKWILVSLAAWFSHILIDGFNSYGTAWFLPFSSYRVAIGSIAVVDAFISLPLLLFLVVVLLKRDLYILTFARWIVGYVGLYLSLSLLLQGVVVGRAANEFERRGIEVKRVSAYAAPFSLLVWQVEGETDSSFVMANQGAFKSNSTEMFSFKKRWELLSPFSDNEDISRVIQFTQGHHIVSQHNDSLIITDLRFAPLVLEGENTSFVVSFPVSVSGDSASVGRGYPKRSFSRETFALWMEIAF